MQVLAARPPTSTMHCDTYACCKTSHGVTYAQLTLSLCITAQHTEHTRLSAAAAEIAMSYWGVISDTGSGVVYLGFAASSVSSQFYCYEIYSDAKT